MGSIDCKLQLFVIDWFVAFKLINIILHVYYYIIHFESPLNTIHVLSMFSDCTWWRYPTDKCDIVHVIRIIKLSTCTWFQKSRGRTYQSHWIYWYELHHRHYNIYWQKSFYLYIFDFGLDVHPPIWTVEIHVSERWIQCTYFGPGQCRKDCKSCFFGFFLIEMFWEILKKPVYAWLLLKLTMTIILFLDLSWANKNQIYQELPGHEPE